jgi:hypothetical protein
VTPEAVDDEGCDCTLANDCMDLPYGSCQFGFEGGCGCVFGCATDDDCNDGQVCVCAGVVGPYAQCVPADCAISSDCGAGDCGLSTQHNVCGDSYALACAGPNESCHDDGECPDAPCPDFPDSDNVAWYCEGAPNQGWSCAPSAACDGVCGRPLFVEGHARLADATSRGDWACASSIEQLDAHTRETLAQHWTQVGRFEHASVASFARFAVHLLRLGAPPQLLRQTHAAMADEIEHARMAFGLASAYAQRELGPGALDVRGSIDAEVDHFARRTSCATLSLAGDRCVGYSIAATRRCVGLRSRGSTQRCTR